LVAPDKLLGARGATLLAREGEEVGTIEQVYLDRETNRPEWALVDTGLFGTRFTFVPLAEATLRGDHLLVPLGKDRIKGAPNIEPTDELSPREEANLYAYYGLVYSEYRSDDEPRVRRTRRSGSNVRLEKYLANENVGGAVPYENARDAEPKERMRLAGDDFTERWELSGEVHREGTARERDIP
jgi:hypothetical protein